MCECLTSRCRKASNHRKDECWETVASVPAYSGLFVTMLNNCGVSVLRAELMWNDLPDQGTAGRHNDGCLTATSVSCSLFHFFFLLLPLCHFEPVLYPISPTSFPLTKSLYLPLTQVSSCTLLTLPAFISLSSSIPLSPTIVHSLCFAILHRLVFVCLSSLQSEALSLCVAVFFSEQKSWPCSVLAHSSTSDSQS